MSRTLRALFVAEGTSDAPLAGVVEDLFLDRGVEMQVIAPDFALLPDATGKDLHSRLHAGRALMHGSPIDLLIAHRDADRTTYIQRRTEIEAAIISSGLDCHPVPVVPVRMTEAWLLLDEQAIRQVAGNPRGRMPLGLPAPQHAENIADPKHVLRQALLTASAATGRRREQLGKRFGSSRRQLLQALDRHGPVTRLASFHQLLTDIDEAAAAVG